MLQTIAPQQREPPAFFLLRSSWLLGSGSDSRGTRCITAVFPLGSPRAESVTLPWRNLPWYINRRISALETASSSHSGGQLSKTNCAMSPALSLGLNKYSLVLPDTRISRKFILSAGTFLEPRTGMLQIYLAGAALICCVAASAWYEGRHRAAPLPLGRLLLLSTHHHLLHTAHRAGNLL